MKFDLKALVESRRFELTIMVIIMINAVTLGLETDARVMEAIGLTRDHGADLDHPALAEGDPLCAHVLYRMDRAGYRALRESNRPAPPRAEPESAR